MTFKITVAIVAATLAVIALLTIAEKACKEGVNDRASREGE